MTTIDWAQRKRDREQARSDALDGKQGVNAWFREFKDKDESGIAYMSGNMNLFIKWNDEYPPWGDTVKQLN